MKLILVGMSHRSAPVAVRERYAVHADRVTPLDEKLLHATSLHEAALISTCNRTELVGLSSDPDAGLEALLRFLHQEIGDASAASEHVYELRGSDVVTHLFEVAASLDSMVVGEAQILGQLKDAYRSAVAARSLGPVLHRLFERAFRSGKRIRSETGLGTSSVSLARVGVALAREVFESFEAKRVLLLGAGEMAESAALGLRDAGVRDSVVLNRSLERAQRLALTLHGHARTLDTLETELALADVVIASIQVERPLLDVPLIERALVGRHGRPLLIIDLGVPRNVDPATQALDGAYVYDLDDLEEVAERGRDARLAALRPARAIIAEERDRFERWYAALPLVPTIRQLRQQVFALVDSELRTLVSQQAEGALEAAQLTRLSEALVAKILHRPLELLRAEAENGAGPYYAEALRRLFDLDKEED